MTTLHAIRERLDSLGTAATTAAEALDGATLDLGDGTLAGLLVELDTRAGPLALVLDRLASAADLVGVCR